MLLLALASASAAAVDDRPADLELIRAHLIAQGIESPDALYHHQTAVLQALAGIERRMGRGEPTYPRARKLHKLLHKHYLRNYRPEADGAQLIPDLGRFNCLSGSLFYGLAARRLGYGVELLHDPGHLSLRLAARDRNVVVETTLPDGFDRPHLGLPAPGREGIPDLIPPNVGRRPSRSGRTEFSLEATLGFTRLNRAWRSLERGETTLAAEQVLLAEADLPALDRVVGARGLLARAFSVDYESGRFEQAYHVARIEVRLFPSMTTSRDRVLAVALKRIEQAADAADAEGAEAIIDEVRLLCSRGSDVARLERRGWPIVAATAVRLADWERAGRAARAYAEVEPDPVEASRLLDWVESRDRDPATAQLRP